MPPRIFIPHIPSANESIIIKGEDARYLAVVLRAARGDDVVLVCPDGARLLAEVVGVGQKEVELRATSEPEQPAPGASMRLVLAQGMLKGQKMDLVIQKATELGAHAIVPLECERTVLRDTRKLERWTKIALEAARQCGRPKPPEVREPVGLDKFLESLKGRARGVIFYEAPGIGELAPEDVPSIQGADETLVVVGPEGGFTRSEVDAASKAGLLIRGLGPYILRAETASIAAISITSYLLRRI